MGRKKRGNVLFARRVHPSTIPELLKLITEYKERFGSTAFIKARPENPDQIKALLEDIAKLTEERDSWKDRHSNAVNATQDQLASYWKREYLKVKAAYDKDHGGQWSQ